MRPGPNLPYTDSAPYPHGIGTSRPTHKGRSYYLTQRSDDRIRLVLDWPPGMPVRTLWTFRATADYYGWTEEFEIWRPKTRFSQGGHDFFQMPCAAGRGVTEGGRTLRIGRGRTAHSNPAGLTNQFKVSNCVTKFDLAELAHFTKGDWTWLEDMSGKRMLRDHWVHIYESGLPSRRAGLVSV